MSADTRVSRRLAPLGTRTSRIARHVHEPTTLTRSRSRIASQGRGRGRGGGRGGAAGGRGGKSDDRPRREAILDLSKYVDKKIRVKFTGGREGESSRQLWHLRTTDSPRAPLSVVGTLKGYDQLLNLVMDDLEETLRGRQSSGHALEESDPN